MWSLTSEVKNITGLLLSPDLLENLMTRQVTTAMPSHTWATCPMLIAQAEKVEGISPGYSEKTGSREEEY